MARKALLAVMMLFPAATASSAVPLAVHSGETSLVIEVADKQRQSLRVTGSVLYFAKINPPAGSKLVVTVADASRADASAIVLARKSYAITTVPFRFALNVPGTSRANAQNNALRAEIRGPGGKLLWVSDTHIPVVAKPGSTQVNVGEIVLTAVK